MKIKWADVLSTLRNGHKYTGDDELASVSAYVAENNIELAEQDESDETKSVVITPERLTELFKTKATRATVAAPNEPEAKDEPKPAKTTATIKAARVDAGSYHTPGETERSRERKREAKAYEIKAATGKTGFTCADEMAEFNAAMRLRMYELSAKQYPSAFKEYKATGQYAEDVAVLGQKDASDTVFASGGALLANTLKNEVLWATEEWGVSRWIARHEIMYGNNTSFARKTSLPTFRPLSSGAAQSSDIGYDTVTLIPKQGAVLITTPMVLFEQSSVALGDVIAESIMEAYWNTIDDCYFLGDGTSDKFDQAGLAIGLTGTPGSTTSGSYITASNSAVSSWVQGDYLLPMYSVRNLNTSRAKWVMSRQHFIGGPLRIASAQSGNRTENLVGTPMTKDNTYLVPSQQRGSAPSSPHAYLYGEPVHFCQRINTTVSSDANKIKAYYGDFVTGSIIGHRTQIEIASSTEYNFAKRALTTRGFAEWAINICGDGRSTSSQCGPIAALQSA